jgi:hypothetical protein
MTDKLLSVEALLLKAVSIIKRGNLNLDISFHTNVENKPRWVVSIEPPAMGFEKIKRCGDLEKCLKEVIDATLERWDIPLQQSKQ